MHGARSSARRRTRPTPSCAGARRSGSRPRRSSAAPHKARSGTRSARRPGASASTHRPGAQGDVFDARERDLGSLREAFPLQPGQSGAFFALGEQFCLDYVSRPEAFARLYPKLLDGYLLDAIEALDRKPTREAALREFLAAAEEAPLSRRPSTGLGEDLRLHRNGVVGSGLELDGELLQVCAFSGDESGARTHIGRPSRRR